MEASKCDYQQRQTHYPGCGETQPFGMTFDGTYVCGYGPFSGELAITSTGTAKYKVNVGFFPTFIAYDGETTQTNGPFLWASNFNSGTVGKIAEGRWDAWASMCATPTNTTVGAGAYGVVFDGAYIWVANGNSNTGNQDHAVYRRSVWNLPSIRSGASLEGPGVCRVRRRQHLDFEQRGGGRYRSF